MSALDIRERLEHEALHAGDSRTRLNALKMLQDLDAKPDAEGTSGPPLYGLLRGALILEPESGSDRRYRLMLRVRGGIEHVADSLKPAEGLYLIASAIGLVEFDEDEIRAAKRRLGMSDDNEVNADERAPVG
jgi:hypothetical protein